MEWKGDSAVCLQHCVSSLMSLFAALILFTSLIEQENVERLYKDEREVMAFCAEVKRLLYKNRTLQAPSCCSKRLALDSYRQKTEGTTSPCWFTFGDERSIFSAWFLEEASMPRAIACSHEGLWPPWWITVPCVFCISRLSTSSWSS